MSDNDLKTLREHNVQVGDVVAIDGAQTPREIRMRHGQPWAWAANQEFICTLADSHAYYRVISRANAAPAIDLTANRMAFGLLDDATKAALEAHVAAGGRCDLYTNAGWRKLQGTFVHDTWIIRAVPKPVRSEVVMTGNECVFGVFGIYACSDDTHRLTLPTSDGALICGTYTGPDGAQVVITTLDGDSK